MEISTKKQLEIAISKLKDFEHPSLELEQYSTPSDIAADLLWVAFMNNDIKDKTIIDAASGPGILGIGALLLGAKKVYFIDINKDSIELSKRNLDLFPEFKEKAEFVNKDIKQVNLDADVVIQNPPFGTKTEHADKVFLEKSFSFAPVIYTMHKSSTKNFIQAISKDHKYNAVLVKEYDFMLRATQKFHKKRIHRIKVDAWRLAK